MQKLYKIILLFTFVFVLSCTKDEDSCSLIMRHSDVSCNKGSMFITVKASGNWDLDIDFGGAEPWASLNHSSGQGNDYSVVLSYDANPSGETRTLALTLTSGTAKEYRNFSQLPKAAAPNYLELPAFVSEDGYGFYTHRMDFPRKNFRNYSFYYSFDDYVALWVAYPLNVALHSSHTREDAFQDDPYLLPSQQAVLGSRGFRDSNGKAGVYDRGHQLPSADRWCTKEANVQTFYGTNMTPQIGNFNQKIWADLEMKVRGYSANATSDTLYVVTGCVVEGSSKYAIDNAGKHVTVPVAYYKALLRYKPGASNTVDGSGYNAIAFYLEHKSYSRQEVAGEDVMSVRELESKLGIDFFTNLQYKVSKETYDKIESQNPLTVTNVWGRF